MRPVAALLQALQKPSPDRGHVPCAKSEYNDVVFVSVSVAARVGVDAIAVLVSAVDAAAAGRMHAATELE